MNSRRTKIPFLFIAGLLIMFFLSFPSCTHSDYDSLMSTDYDTNCSGSIVADKNNDNDNDEDDDNGTVLQADDTKEKAQKKIPPAAFDKRDSFIYALQKVNYEMLASAEFDVAVVDPDDSKLDKYDIDDLHSQDKSIIAYLSIGEAENYRNYWGDDWETGNPSFLEEENPNWIGNFKVKYWDGSWQEIIFELLSQITGKGYDGVYLDLVDAYTYFTERGYPDARLQMIDFVLEISRYARNQKKDFLIIPQNAEELIVESEYLNAIDGVGRENLWFLGDNPQNKTESDISIGYLNQIIEAGKFVFVISYSQEEENIKSFITLAQNRGFIPYVGPIELDRIKNIDNYSE